MNIYVIILILCSLIIFSYIFNIFARATKIPSVLMLIFLGVGLKYISGRYGFDLHQVRMYVGIFGAIGLVMIVLEGSLELHLSKDKFRIMLTSFITALTMLFVSSFLVSLILYFWLKEPLIICFVYAIPLSVISSAIMLPSVVAMDELKKEALTYEAIFSDILGILLFNFFVFSDSFDFFSIAFFVFNISTTLIVSVIASFLLLYLLSKVHADIKLFLLLSILLSLYSIGKIYHLSALLLILIFGLIFNNTDLIRIQYLKKHFDFTVISPAVTQLKLITAESSFFIRTFFFIFFGYSINFYLIFETTVLISGFVIVLIFLVIRYIYLKYNLKTKLMPSLLMMPRGLVSIILFYEIPAKYKIMDFNEGILFFVIIATNLLMTIGLMNHKNGD